MLGKLCVTKVDKESVDGYFIADRREEFVQIKREMINVPLVPGNVVRIDYSWRSIAVFEVLADKYFKVSPVVLEHVKFEHVQIADSQEEADALFESRLRDNYDRLKESLETERVKVEIGD